MEREMTLRGQEQVCSPTIDMFHYVTQITGFHQLAEVYSLEGNKTLEAMFRRIAVLKGVQVIALTENNNSNKKALDRTLAWLQGRDYEMHKSVQGTLYQSQAVRDTVRLNGGGVLWKK